MYGNYYRCVFCAKMFRTSSELCRHLYLHGRYNNPPTPTDDTVGPRYCLKCGTSYVGKHSECPHGDRVTSLIETL